MSSPSKRRRQARAWMQETTAANTRVVARLEHEIARLRHPTTLGENDAVFWPQDPSGVRVTQIVRAYEPRPTASDEQVGGFRLEAAVSGGCVETLIRAVQMALPLPGGRSVRWLAWERLPR